LLPWSPRWPLAAATLAAELRACFAADTVRIEHIGSTAVPGLLAKPVLDLMLGTATLAVIEARIPALTALGYTYVDRYERELPQRRYFTRQPPDAERIHLHGLVHGDILWREHLRFRDALRTDAVLCARYAALKSELAARGLDKADYTAAKAPFIRAVLDGPAPKGASLDE
jgi:GrpB-like predicted nucleotidyltransferase (UPF0157 family)